MNLFEKKCENQSNTENKLLKKPNNNNKYDLLTSVRTKMIDSGENIKIRDGMSSHTASFQIRKCTNLKNYKIHAIENKGRYFRASILDKSGKKINELLVDKLNGNVKFIR
jgi:hypothetical protein